MLFGIKQEVKKNVDYRGIEARRLDTNGKFHEKTCKCPGAQRRVEARPFEARESTKEDRCKNALWSGT